MSLTRKDIDDCIKGDLLAQSKFCKHVFRMVLIQASKVAKTPEDAIDWTNSIMLHLMNKLHYFRGYEEDTGKLKIGTFYQWVIVVSRKMCTGNYMKIKNFNVKLLPEDFTYNISSDNEADSALLHDSLLNLVDTIITAPRKVEIFKLYADGWSDQDIADKLKISKGTVKWSISEARALLRDKLYSMGYDRKYYKGGSAGSANNYRAAREPLKKTKKL